MGIVFARAWEDDRLDAELLAVEPGERALVVAGAGDTALALAAGGGEVVAVDLNPDQLRLGALKLAAATVLPPERLHAWFETRSDPAVRAEYRQYVRSRLAPADRAWWDRNIGLFDRGLHRSTRLARRYLALARLGRLVRPDMPRRVESFRSPAQQAAWWHRRLRWLVFSPVTHWLLGRGRAIALFSPQATETERVRRGQWSRGLARRIDGVLENVLVREHPWWRPLASGRPIDPGHGAAWLDPDRVAALAGTAAQAGCVRWVEADLTSALAAEPPASLDAISVSNVPDWLGEGGERRLADAARTAAKPGGRVLVRHLVRPAGSDAWLASGFRRDPRSDDLPSRDRTALYEAIDLYTRPDQ